MSSPTQPPLPNIRPPSSTPLSQPPLSSSGPSGGSPFAQQQLPPPITSGGSARPSLTSTATSRPLPPPSIGGDMPYHNAAMSSPSTLTTSGPSYASVPQQQSMPSLPSPSALPGSGAGHRSNSNSSNSSKLSLPPIPPRGAPLPPPPSSSSFSETGPPRTQAASPPATLLQQPSRQSTQPPATSTATTPTTSNNAAGGGYRPLNVRDALTYLDQVKIQFSARPDVYNQFLDIMKDFKSQAIDTPGVIERVSMLFNGHPELISGFNTFLPPGYRIECSSDPNEPDVIKVTTPSGTTHKRTSRAPASAASQQGAPRGREQEIAHSSSMAGVPPQPPPPTAGSYYQPPYGHMPPPPPPPSSSSSLPPPQSLPPPMSSHAMHPSQHSSYIPAPSGSRRPPPPLSTHEQPEHAHMNGGSGTRRAPVEFNHAINYVNKIKNRYAGDPETYKQFLEILQTYQKERKPIQEVYQHVQYLFNGAPDLLHEFKQFLPEITGQPAPDFLDDLEPAPYMGSKRMYGTPPQGAGYLPPGKKKRTVSKRSKGQKAGLEEDMIGGYPASSYFDPARPTISAEEVELFEHIRKHIGNKPSYEEFLKTLNLYTQQIIDADGLMKQVEGFLGNDRELFDWFKNVVAVDLKDQVIERPANPIPKPDLNHCKTVESSPSYRLVSKEWQNQPCSGRDQLCWEVLNDEYVSHPIWASEDSGFVASKKNQYEEAMHRCEEERYDYDLNIDANLNAIALLEPLAKSLEVMTPEEKSAFRLEPGLGGQSVTIYERIIKKVYEDERGKEIIEMLYNHPARVVPILLKRLSQKDEEWRKAQHEWNKAWREMDAKNFYRALDYQGLTFKSIDRKAMAVKSLVTEIETLHEEARANDKEKADPLYPLLFSFEDAQVFKDATRLIFSYIEKQNGFSSSDRSKIRTFVKIFIPLFFHVDDAVPEGLAVDSDDADEGSAEEDNDSQSIATDDSDADVSRSPRDRSRSPGRRRNGRSRAEDTDGSVDLLRDVLTKKSKSTTADDNDTVNSFDTGAKSPSAQREFSVTPAPDDDDEDEEESANNNNRDGSYEDKPIKTEETSADEREVVMSPQAMSADDHSNAESNEMTEASQPLEDDDRSTRSNNEEGNRLFAAAAAATAPGLHKRTIYSFFCNTAFYCFFRLYQLAYERLLKMKQLDAEMRADPERKGKRVNKAAIELGLYTNRFDDIDTSNGYYNALLDLIDRFFDGELDQAMFEEKTRYIFVTEAHVLFTIDKLIHSIIKQIQLVTMDEKCVELVELFRSDQTLDSTCPRIMSVYRLRAEETVGSDENLYKANFNTETHRMSIQLLDKDDDLLEASSMDHYENYVASYMDWANSTDGIDTSKMYPTFLRRNWKPHDRHLSKIFVRSRLQYKISQENYHMYYIIGSEDAFVRPPISAGDDDADATARKTIEAERKKKWHHWLESRSTGWGREIESDEAYNSMEAAALKLLTE